MPNDEKLPPTKGQLDRHTALTMTWKDGTQSVYPVRYLREQCPCASCRGHRAQSTDPLQVIRHDVTVPEDIHVESLEPVGHYALRFQFSDGHGTGIYSYEFLLIITPPAA